MTIVSTFSAGRKVEDRTFTKWTTAEDWALEQFDSGLQVFIDYP